MQSTKNTNLGGFESTFSRRNFLIGAAALTAAANVPKAFGQQPTGAPRGTVWLYISTYTGAPEPEEREGIYLCELNLSTGKLNVLRLVAPALPASGTNPSTASPSTIALDPTRTHLYAGNEYGPPGAVSAYSINRLTGDLTLLNGQPAVGAPAHVSVDQQRQVSFLGRILRQLVRSLPNFARRVARACGVSEARLSVTLTLVTTKPATNAPPGSFAFSAHEGPNGHPHQMEADPSNQWVLGTDAGQDRIYVWKLTPGGYSAPDSGCDTLREHAPGRWAPALRVPPQRRLDVLHSGRSVHHHVLAFQSRYGSSFATTDHPECAAGIHRYGLHFGNPRFRRRRLRLRGKPPERHHRRFLRSAAMARLLRKATLQRSGIIQEYSPSIPPGGSCVSGNQRADNVTTFSVNPGNGNQGQNQWDDDQGENQGGQGHGPGSLTFTGDYTPVGSPSGMVFLT